MRYFLDTEFIESGSENPLYLLSIGLVAEDGREYYAQLYRPQLKNPKASDWVARHVYPHLVHFDLGEQGRACSPKSGARCGGYDGTPCPWRYQGELTAEIREFTAFVDGQKPEFWGYYADYDWVVFCQLFGSMINLPEGWPMYCRDLKQLCDDLGNPELPPEGKNEHHALADARWNAKVYGFLTGYRFTQTLPRKV